MNNCVPIPLLEEVDSCPNLELRELDFDSATNESLEFLASISKRSNKIKVYNCQQIQF